MYSTTLYTLLYCIYMYLQFFVLGGLLIALPREQAAAYCREIEKTEGYPAWIVGVVEQGDKTARMIEKPRCIEVPAKNDPNKLW